MKTVAFLLSLTLPAIVAADTLDFLNLRVNAVAYDATDDLILTTCGSTVPGRGNTVTGIDPYTPDILFSTFVGSEPGQMLMSASDTYAWVALAGTGGIARFDTATRTLGLSFFLPTGTHAGDIAAYPGAAETLAVAVKANSGSPSQVDTRIYDNGVMRPQVVHPGNYIEFSDTIPTRLYGYDSEISSYQFTRNTLTATGLVPVDSIGGLIVGNHGYSVGAGLIFVDNGQVIDGELRQQIGSLEGGSIAIDAPRHRVFLLNARNDNNQGNVYINSWDLNTYTPIGHWETTIPNSGGASALVRYGTNGLAFRLGNGQMAFVRSIIVNGTYVLPQSFSLLRGLLVSGGLSSLQYSDDSYLRLRPGVVLSTSQPPISLQVESTSPTQTASHLRFEYESSCTAATISEKIYLFNFVTNAFEQISSRSTTTGDTRVVFDDMTNAQRFVEPTTRAMQARIEYKQTAPIISYPWVVSVDQAAWRVAP